LIGLATVGKVIGCGVPALASGLSFRSATAVGVGMNARGAVELVIADIALQAGLFSLPEPPPPAVAHLFSAVVLMAIVTTIATPLGLRWVFLRQ
jgi:Kef-type K+ transport system membrane component KefB